MEVNRISAHIRFFKDISGTGMEGYMPGNGQLASLGLGMLAGERAAASLKSKV